MEGSAVSGYVQSGKYFLSVGKASYVETAPDHFEEVKRREEALYEWLGGMILSILAAVIMIKLAGLPLELEKNRPVIRTLHPSPTSRVHEP